MASIPTIVCPTVTFPKHVGTKNLRRKTESLEHLQRSSSDPVKRIRSMVDSNDMRSIYESIKEFNANELKGKERLKYKKDKLGELGAPPEKQPNYSFKTRMKRIVTKRERGASVEALLQESGQVLPRSIVNSFQTKTSKVRREKERGPNIGVRTVKGVHHVKK